MQRLNRLIEIEFDAVEAYAAAADRLAADGDPEDRRWIAGFLADHRRHAEDLASLVRNLGGEPASHGDLRRVLGRTGRDPSEALGSEELALAAVAGAERAAARAYDLSSSQFGIPVDVLAAIDRNGCEERAHLSWIERRLGAAGHASSAAKPPHPW